MSDCSYLNTITLESELALDSWLSGQATANRCQWLLAHALDGVIWGRFDNGMLITSHDVEPTLPALQLDTLLQCRIFGATTEVMLWRNDIGWHATTITDPPNDKEYIDEEQMLWGDQGNDVGHGFTLLSDGSQGLNHTVPLQRSDMAFSREPVHRPVRLTVRHLLGKDERTGAVFVRASRLVRLYAVPVEGAKQ